MSKLSDLLAQIEAEDPEAAEAIKAEMVTATNKSAALERDLKLMREPKFRNDYPRALAMIDKGKISLPDDPSDAALAAFLKGKEDEYAEAGVPIPGAAATPESAEPSDPASAFGEPVSGGQIAPKQDYVRDVVEKISKGGRTGREEAVTLLTQLNMEEGYNSPKIAEIAAKLNAKPILSRW